MVRAWWANVGAGALLSVALVGCRFDASGSGGSGQLGDTASEGTGSTETSGSTMSGSSTQPSGESTSDPPDPTASSEPTTTDPSGGSDTEDPPGDAAVLELSEGGDFGLVEVESSQSFAFTLTNVGAATANAITPTVMPAAFAIGTTDCGSTLAPAAACTIEIVFAPQAIGPHGGTLAVAYHDGVAEQGVARDLVGGGQGESRNLIENPGGEDCSTSGGPPDGWYEVTGSNWTCIDTFGDDYPTEGSTMFFPAVAPTGSFPDLAQQVSVPANLVEHVQNGDVAMRFSGWSISAGMMNDDPRRFRLEFLDGGGTAVDAWDSGWLGSPMWAETVEIRVPHTATETIVVHLDCEVTTPSNCSAMFDQLGLRFFYPPP